MLSLCKNNGTFRIEALAPYEESKVVEGMVH